MKKLFCMLVSLVLLCSAAQAETLFESSMGYTLSYPEDRIVAVIDEGMDEFRPIDADADSDAYVIIVSDELDFTENADDKLSDAAGGFFFEEAAEIGEIQPFAMTSGIAAKTIEVRFDGMTYRYYAVEVKNGLLCITAAFPQAQAETLGTLFEELVQTIAY